MGARHQRSPSASSSCPMRDMTARTMHHKTAHAAGPSTRNRRAKRSCVQRLPPARLFSISSSRRLNRMPFSVSVGASPPAAFTTRSTKGGNFRIAGAQRPEKPSTAWPCPERVDSRGRLDLQLARDALSLVAGGGGGALIFTILHSALAAQQARLRWAQRFAAGTPWRPKIHDNRRDLLDASISHPAIRTKARAVLDQDRAAGAAGR